MIFCIRVTTLYNGLLGPADGLILATLSRFGCVVWWKFVQWACSHQNNVRASTRSGTEFAQLC